MFLCVLGLSVPGWVVLLKTILRSPHALVLSVWFFSGGECFSFPNCVCLITTLMPPRASLFGGLPGSGSLRDRMLLHAATYSSFIWNVHCSQCSDCLASLCVGVIGNDIGWPCACTKLHRAMNLLWYGPDLEVSWLSEDHIIIGWATYYWEIYYPCGFFVSVVVGYGEWKVYGA